MGFSEDQLVIFKSSSPKVVFELNNEEVLAFWTLAQMHNKVVRMTDNFFGNTRVGVFTIDHLNGDTNLDFSNDEDWRNVVIDSISLSLTCPNDFGGTNKSTFQSIFDIKSIALLSI